MAHWPDTNENRSPYRDWTTNRARDNRRANVSFGNVPQLFIDRFAIGTVFFYRTKRSVSSNRCRARKRISLFSGAHRSEWGQWVRTLSREKTPSALLSLFIIVFYFDTLLLGRRVRYGQDGPKRFWHDQDGPNRTCASHGPRPGTGAVDVHYACKLMRKRWVIFFGENSIFPASTFGARAGKTTSPYVRGKRVRPPGLSGSTREFDRSEPYGNMRNKRLKKKKKHSWKM